MKHINNYNNNVHVPHITLCIHPYAYWLHRLETAHTATVLLHSCSSDPELCVETHLQPEEVYVAYPGYGGLSENDFALIKREIRSFWDRALANEATEVHLQVLMDNSSAFTLSREILRHVAVSLADLLASGAMRFEVRVNFDRVAIGQGDVVDVATVEPARREALIANLQAEVAHLVAELTRHLSDRGQSDLVYLSFPFPGDEGHVN